MKNLLWVMMLLLLPRVAFAETVPTRIFDGSGKPVASMDAMLDDLAKQDVVFVGEIHDDLSCHQLELAILQGLTTRRGHLTLGMEMFERDVQAVLDGYLDGEVSAEEFAARARPWQNYAVAYAPLVDFCKANHEPVLASNVPQLLASLVAQHGLGALLQEPLHVMAWCARQVSDPEDDYFHRFQQAMQGHGADHGTAGDMLKRFYAAQCLRDDTMAESVSDYVTRMGGQAPLVLHVNGDFHSDFGLGTAARTRARLPQAHVAVVSLIPVDSLDAANPAEDTGRADYLVYCPRHQEGP
ncbi:MAG: ChaN family lipoprotein [Candidatus Xenobia bacterium]